MKRRVIFIVTVLLLGSGLGRAGEIPVGLLSFDEFIPASGSAAGINSFDIFDFTGPSYGPTVGPPFASESLTFEGVKLTVSFSGGSSQSFDLGDIGPGELLDSSGNPIIQFPSTDDFSSAILTATLSPTTFTLSNETKFIGSGPISVDLRPSSGSTLSAGRDFATIDSEETQVTPVPESSTLVNLVLANFITLIASLWTKRLGFHTD
jgi:hypothetical protein